MFRSQSSTRNILISFFLALLLTLTLTGSASATSEEECSGNWDGGLCDPGYDPDPPPVTPEVPDPLNLAASTHTSIDHEDELCDELNAINDDREPEACGVEETLTQTAAEEITAEQLRMDGDLVSAKGVSLAAAAKAGKIYYKTWTQSMRGLYYVNWKEEHRGLVYFDGTNVWISSNRGYAGYHRCDFNSGIGYSVSVTDCTENFKNNANGTRALQQWDIFKVHVVAKGIPIYRTYSMHANAYKTGTITFY